LKRILSVAAASVLAIATVGPVRAQEAGAAPDSAAVTRAELQGLLDGMNEQIQVLTADTDKLKRFKFSGYIQARAEFSEASSDSVRVSGATGTLASANATRFYIRRARLKLTYDSSPLSQGVVYFDGGSDRTVRLLEAYVTLLDPWTALHVHQFTAGQFNVPFGYEIERSSSVRELPERSRVENVLFSGERDRGAKFESQWTRQLKTTFSLLNGTGINSVDFPATDPTRGKDWSARARWSQGIWDAAVSYYDGRNVTPLTGPDVLTDKTRLGADIQTYWSLGPGGGTLRGEAYSGHEVNPDSVRILVIPPSAGSPARLLRPAPTRTTSPRLPRLLRDGGAELRRPPAGRGAIRHLRPERGPRPRPVRALELRDQCVLRRLHARSPSRTTRSPRSVGGRWPLQRPARQPVDHPAAAQVLTHSGVL
jgi:hypothetical protein